MLPPERVCEGSKGWGWNQIRQAGRDCPYRGRALRGLGIVCFPSQGVCELSKGAGSAIRVGNWGGPLGAKRGLWRGWGLSPFFHTAWAREGCGCLVGSRKVLERASRGRERAVEGFGFVCILSQGVCERSKGRAVRSGKPFGEGMWGLREGYWDPGKTQILLSA